MFRIDSQGPKQSTPEPVENGKQHTQQSLRRTLEPADILKNPIA